MRRQTRALRLWIESYEPRRLLAVGVVTGTSGPDTIGVQVSGSNLVVTLNGTPTGQPLAGLDGLVINAGAGADTITIDSTSVDVTVNGEAGNDTVTLAPTGKNLNAVTGSVRFNGGPDVDSYFLRDDNSGAVGRTYGFGALEPNDVFRSGTGFHSHGGVEVFNLYAGPGDDLFDFNNALSGTLFNLHGNAGVDTYDVYRTPGTSRVIAHAGSGDDIVRGLGTADFPAVVELPESDQLGILSTTADSTVRFGNPSLGASSSVVIRIANSWTNAGTIDIRNGILITADGASNLDELTLQEQLYQGTLGNKPSIVSSYASASSQSDGIGVAKRSDAALSFAGPFSIGPGDVVARYTSNGDFDLSGTTNFDDLLRLAANYNTLVDMLYAQGDANYDGGVNFDDLLILASAYNTSVPQPFASPSAAPAPLVAPGRDSDDDAPSDVLV